MIVAHPDDETIFGGGFLQENPGTHVICMTNRTDRIRSIEFHRAMKLLDCVYSIFDLYDDANIDLPFNQVRARISSIVPAGAKIVTHAASGEYGHRHHLNIHAAVLSITDDFYVFGKGKRLPEAQIIKKKSVLTVYDSQVRAFPLLMDFIENETIVKYAAK